MQLVTIVQNGERRLGALTSHDGQDVVIDLNRALPALPSDILEFLAGGAESHALATQAIAGPPAAAVLPRSAVRLGAPVPRPGKIICIGLNYRDHAAESNQAVPDFPTVFAKYASCVIGPGEPIVIPRVTSEVDYEGELAVVIGRRARDVREEEALNYVAGYAPFNDVSARDYQMRTSQWTIGKTFDSFGPLGPALVTADEVGDPHTLDLRVSIGDELLQSSNTRHLIFRIPFLIAYLSAVMTLDPGDVIATGTPAGVGAARSPKRWLRPGETVRVEIERLGALENPVVAAGG
jgi:2-keto-4-pentenoate hydratase/2-oxohepta-3-ene-1,7-dioic acid hydratase in catechol pathway